jgi:hypothetical protein
MYTLSETQIVATQMSSSPKCGHLLRQAGVPMYVDFDISHSRFKQMKGNLVCLFKSYAPYFALQGSCFHKQELI